jgi:hypothetical protein
LLAGLAPFLSVSNQRYPSSSAPSWPPSFQRPPMLRSCLMIPATHHDQLVWLHRGGLAKRPPEPRGGAVFLFLKMHVAAAGNARQTKKDAGCWIVHRGRMTKVLRMLHLVRTTLASPLSARVQLGLSGPMHLLGCPRCKREPSRHGLAEEPDLLHWAEEPEVTGQNSQFVLRHRLHSWVHHPASHELACF